MARNLNGLNGRNVMFWKFGIPINAYIIKYAPDGKYYALSKSNGKLYEFRQDCFSDSDGAWKERLKIKRVEYHTVEKYGLHINENNWRDFIDFGAKNVRICIDDVLDTIRDILRIAAILFMLVGCLAAVAGAKFNFAFVGLPAAFCVCFGLFIGGYHYYAKDNLLRAELHEYGPKDKIDY